MIEVSIVIVPPHGDGRAFGHDHDGRCVEIRGPRARMLELFHQLRNAGKQQPAAVVTLDPARAGSVEIIDQETCPTHTLPPGADIRAWAPY